MTGNTIANQYDCAVENCDWYGCKLAFDRPDLSDETLAAMGCLITGLGYSPLRPVAKTLSEAELQKKRN